MTTETRRRIEQALADTRRFIRKEEARSADIRPDHVKTLLNDYKAHEARLIAMLAGN